MKKGSFWIALLAGFLWVVPTLSFAAELRIGVLASRGAHQVAQEWKSTAEYLEAKTGSSVSILPLEYEQIAEWTKQKKIDFIFTNPAMYAELNLLYGVQAVATQVNQFNKQPLDQFGLLLFTKSDSNIETLADLQGKSVGCASRDAFAGWLMGVRFLMENGIDPATAFTSVRELRTHDNVIWAVLNGAVDVGSIRTGTLEKMVLEGKVKTSDFKIIRRITDDFPLMHTTQLYPENPMAACQHVPAELRKQVGALLVAIRPTDQPALDANIAGWKEPSDYRPVVECLTIIKYGVFKDRPLAAPVSHSEKAVEVAAQPAPPAVAAPDLGQAKAPARSPRGRASGQ